MASKCKTPLSDDRAAAMLASLGSVVRLHIFRSLLRAGNPGVNVSGLQRSLGIPASTLNHHLGALVDAGLVVQRKDGRELLCRAQYSDIRLLSAFLLQECCADAPLEVVRLLSVD